MRTLFAFVALAVAAAFEIGHRNGFEEREVARIRAHFDSVLVELRGADPAGLSPAQRSHRARLIATLRGYRDAGAFPHNYDYAQPTPQFVDRKTGTRCAMAYLLESTGEQALVARIRRTNNSVRVTQLASDTSLDAWLRNNGLTLEEAARIQPGYSPYPMIDESPNDYFGVTHNVLAIISGVGSTAMAVTNVNRNQRSITRGALSLLASAASFGVSWPVRSDTRVNRTTHVLNLMAGSVSALTGLHAMFLADRAPVTDKPVASKVSVAPTLDATNGATGLTLTLRF